MTRTLSLLLIALFAAPALTACYEHPAPVDGGARDGGPPTDPTDAQADAHEPPPDAEVECETDADCEATACELASCVEGECAIAPVEDGTACDDGDLCTTSDACTAGACRGAERACAACSAGGGGATLTTLVAAWSKGPEAMLTRADGTVVLTGFGDSQLWVAAVGADGAVLVDRGHGDPARGDWGFAIARPVGADDARTLVAGYSQIDGGAARPWLIEVDAAGEQLASHAPFGDRGGSVHGLAPLPDGATIVVANVDGHAALARLSPELEIEWERSYFDVGWAYGLAGVAVLPDGDLVIAGDVGTFPARTVHVVRARPTGEVIWESVLTADGVGAILARPDGSIVIGGKRRSDGTGSAWLARVDALGAVTWESWFGTDPNGSIQSIAAAPDGSLLVAAADGGAALIVRADAGGVLLEEARLSLGSEERGEAVQVLADGTVIVAGTSDLPELEGPRHAWVARAGSVSSFACAD